MAAASSEAEMDECRRYASTAGGSGCLGALSVAAAGGTAADALGSGAADDTSGGSLRGGAAADSEADEL
ncbi:hypothetical protein ACQWKR_24080, partial [Salmonella enterica subsp. enterica serovar Infantis]